MNFQLYDQIKTILTSARDIFTSSLPEKIKHLRMVLPQLDNYTDERLEKMIQISLNYEEVSRDIFGLSDAIRWIKENFDKTRYGGGCILRGQTEKPNNDNSIYGFESNKDNEPALDYSSQFASYPITIQLCFLDKHGEPILTPEAKHMVVHCKKIEPDLERQFGSHDLVILR